MLLSCPSVAMSDLDSLRLVTGVEGVEGRVGTGRFVRSIVVGGTREPKSGQGLGGRNSTTPELG